MSMITVERAIDELNEAGALTLNREGYNVLTVYTFTWQEFVLKSQAYITDRTRHDLPGINIFSVRRSLHPVLSIYQQYVAIRRMTDAGYTVKLDELTDHRFRVRVQRKEGRAFTYNDHTTSTSGYPIVMALEKWHTFVDRKKREENEAEYAASQSAFPTRFEVLFYESDRDGVFYHGQTRRMDEPATGFLPLSSPSLSVSGIRRTPYFRVEVEAPTAATAESQAFAQLQEWTAGQDTVVKMKTEVGA